MHVRLIRHATLQVDMAGLRVLIDPSLDPAGARPPVEGTPRPRRNPLVDLPEPAEIVARDLDALIITHLHEDHLDRTALRLLPREPPVLCQQPDVATLRERGFADIRPVDHAIEIDGIRIVRTEGRHGTGEIGDAMAPVSGFVLAATGEPTLYVAGDTVWCEDVRAALDEHRPDVVVVNAGGTRFVEGDPITMTADDVLAVANHAPGARVIAVHMEAFNHCVETRADLHQRIHEADMHDRITVPEDGAEVPL